MASLRELSAVDLEGWFPHLREESFKITSPETEVYNCIAWAAGEDIRKWDPSNVSGRYWPLEVRRGFDLDAFIELYRRTSGYEPCKDGSVEEGFQKIALYVGGDSEVKHAALQLPSGLWTSKLGDFEDIEHTLRALEGGGYGWVRQFLRRNRV